MKRLISIYIKPQILMLLFASILMSCVGTVKDTNPISTKVLDNSDKTIKGYEGVVLATPISDNKVEILFNQVEGNPDDFSYSISYDGQIIPILIDSNNIRPEADNDKLKFTIDSLNPNTTYNFSVQIKHKKKGILSSNTNKRTAKTFNNITANFFGVSELRNVSGAEGKTSLQVFWPEAIRTGPPLGQPNPGDPVSYKVTVVNANNLTTVDINDESKGSPNRLIFTANKELRSIIVRGLAPNTKYYVQVRAIHAQAKISPYSSDLSYKVEANSKYLTINTFSNDPPTVNMNSLALTHSPGYGGYFAINSKWEFPAGNYDHIRLYYSQTAEFNATAMRNYLNASDHDQNCDDAESSPLFDKIFCQKVPSTLNKSTLTNLSPNIGYSVIAAVCLDIPCRQHLILEGKELTTTPLPLGFDGIKSIEAANTLDRLDQLFLNYNVIDLTKGHVDGLEIYYTNDPLDASPDNLTARPELYVDDFALQDPTNASQTKIVIAGLTLDGATTHCFDVYPYTINAVNARVENRIGYPRQCINNALISAPSSLEFPGLLTSPDDVTCDAINKVIEVKWKAPARGVFSHYELYYQKVNSPADSFSFDQGINGAINYNKINIGSSLTERTIGILPAGQYKLGILSYYYNTNLGQVIRSTYNGNIVYCNIQ